MWAKALIIILLFYFFAVLQNSFLVHFNIYGTIPNIIFIFFFLLIFFEGRKSYYQIISWSIVAGFFLDVFSSSYFGVSIAVLLLIGILTKKIANSLKERRDEYPFVYFVPLFLGFFMSYEIILRLCFYFLNQNYSVLNLSWVFCIEIIYNLALAFLGFYIYPVRNSWLKNFLKRKNFSGNLKG